MAEPDLTGVRVQLTGNAEPALVEATHAAFGAVGADVAESIGDASRAIAMAPEPPGVGVVFARPRRPSNRPILEVDDATLDDEVGRQLLAPQRAAIALARSMAGASGGVIVLVGSVDAYHAYPGRSVAAVAMGGLLGLTRAIAVELAGHGIRADLVVAGPLGLEDGSAPLDADQAAVERTLLRSPSHRFARPSEVAAAIRFVARPGAGFMTGQTLRVDGGWASLNQAPEGMRFP
jgi:3-oxoacyl-[acyl-carrier protein] reductase